MQLLRISNSHEKDPVSMQFFGKNITGEKYVSLLQAHDREMFTWAQGKGVLGL